MEPLLELKNASKVYRQAQVKTAGITDVSLQIYPHEFIAVTGRSGCGKSTLLNILGCMDELTSGSYYFEGADVSHLKLRQGAQFRNKKIGYVFQAFNLVNEITALENVCMPLGYAGVGKKQREKAAYALLEKVGMAEKARKCPVFLSGGEQQRVAIARALANGPQILLADEPTGNLDEQSSRAVMALFAQLNQQGMTIVMVTHSEEIAAYAGRQIHIRDGRIATA